MRPPDQRFTLDTRTGQYVPALPLSEEDKADIRHHAPTMGAQWTANWVGCTLEQVRSYCKTHRIRISRYPAAPEKK